MDLLYDHKLYNDVLRIYAEVKKRTSERNMYVSSAVNAIVFATYFRLVGAEYTLHAFRIHI